MKRALTFAAIAAAAGVLASASASADDVPVYASVYAETWPSKMQINCTNVAAGPSGRRRIACDFTQVNFERPPEKLEESLAKEAAEFLASLRKTPGAFAKTCAEVRRYETVDAGADTSLEFEALLAGMPRMRAACGANDPAAFVEAFTASQRRTRAGECRVGLMNSFHETLERVDANTWVGTDGPRGLCDVTVTTTLWRDAGFWSFRSVMVTPPSMLETERCKGFEPVRTTTMTWRATTWRTHCDHVKM